MQATYGLTVTRDIRADARSVWNAFADYAHQHPKILPKAFRHFRLESGGQGAGTRFTVELHVGGRKLLLKGIVTEPVSGQILQETFDDGTVTEIEVVPIGQDSQVTISTKWPRKPGFAGWIEAQLVPRTARKLYLEELDNLQTLLNSKR